MITPVILVITISPIIIAIMIKADDRDDTCREKDVIRPATCEGSEARRSRWTRTDFDQHSVNKEHYVNKEHSANKEHSVNGEHSEQHSVIRDNEGTSSKFEAALKDFEALEQGQGARYHIWNVKCSIAVDYSRTQ